MVKFSDKGSGWHGDSQGHSEAVRYGRRGSSFEEVPPGTRVRVRSVKGQFIRRKGEEGIVIPGKSRWSSLVKFPDGSEEGYSNSDLLIEVR